MTRTSGSLTVATQPSGAEVFVDGQSRGVTQPGVRASGPSSPVLVLNLLPGQYRLRIVRDCFAPYDVPFNIPEPPVDTDIGTIELEPAVGTALIEAPTRDAIVYVDGERRGAATEPVTNICAGPHVVEARSPRGRFVDRREWRAGDSITLRAELRKAFVLIDTAGGAGTLDRALASQVEEAVSDARRVMVFAPLEAELAAARAAAGQTPADPALAIAARRALAETWAGQLDAQGVAWLAPMDGAGETLGLHLLAAGSGTPDVVPLRLADLASRAAATRALGVAPPAIVRASLEASLVDVTGVTGAATVRVVPGGVSERAGLAVGEVIVAVDDVPVTSAAEIGRAVERVGPGRALRLSVASAQGDRAILVPAAEVADAIPLGDRNLLSNTLLLDMQDTLASAGTPLAQAAARLSLAIAHIRLANWDLALRELDQVTLPDGPGVSAGTVAYLTGLCLTEISRLSDAQAAFRRAVADTGSRLFIGGPPVAPLAQQRLDEMMRP